MFRIPPVKCEPQNILLDKYIKQEHDITHEHNIKQEHNIAQEHDIAHEHNIKYEHIDESTEYKLDYNGYYNQPTYQCYTKVSKNTKENVQIKFEVDVIDDAIVYENICVRDDNDLPSVETKKYCNINSHVENDHANFNLNIESSSTEHFSPTKNKMMKTKKNDRIQNEVHAIDDDLFGSFVNHDNNYMPSAESESGINSHVENKPTNFNLNIKSSTTTYTPSKHKVIILKKNNQIITEVDVIDDVKYESFFIRDNNYVPVASTTYYSINSHVEKKPTHCNLNIKASTTHFKPTKSKVMTSKKSVKKLHECFICNKSFSSKGNMKTHSRLHTGEKPYQCFICNKFFAQASTLNTHKIIHKTHKPFNCAICKKSFAQKGQILIHMNKHKILL